MTRVAIAGGGLAGMAAAAALGGAGFEVDLFEAHPHLGGRATSYPLPGGEIVDNCQHVLLPSCVNLLDLYGRLGARESIEFHSEIPFIEPGGRVSVLRPGVLPAPLHFFGSFRRLQFLKTAGRLAVGRALLAMLRERRARGDLGRITMLDWLREKRQPRESIDRFWRPVLVSAINEELDRMAACHAFQVFWLGFLARRDAARIGLPTVPLAELYALSRWQRIPGVRLHLRQPVERVAIEGGRAKGVRAAGATIPADHVIVAAPFEKAAALAPELALDFEGWRHSPITGVHLWFDRPVTDRPFAALLDRTVQWFFNKDRGRYLLLVVSASRSLVEAQRGEIVDLARSELAEFLPAARTARVEKAHVVKEVHATFSAAPGIDERRPPAATTIPGLYLAGDWTRTGWPATMEGAVRGGYLAAEAVAAAAGRPQRFLLRDIA
jgi:squalene-associated FAD-dependent desaturase